MSQNRVDVILNHFKEREDPITVSHTSNVKNHPQPTVISEGQPHCAVLVIKVRNQGDFPLFLKKSGAFTSIIDKLCSNQTTPFVIHAGIGFGVQIWNKSSNAEFGEYKTRLNGKFGGLPYTPYDLVVHVKASTRSLCYEVIDEFVSTLPRDLIDEMEDHYGWQYQDGRDLSGFIDGTMNTVGEMKRSFAALNRTGGSFLIHQRWEHNIDFLRKETTKEQERWVGRVKSDSEEHSKEKIDVSSHVTRMRDEKFNRIPVVRQSMPFGSVTGKKGLLFIAYANDVSKFDKMLDRMTDSTSDSIMKYSKCVSGNYYYFPSLEELVKLK